MEKIDDILAESKEMVSRFYADTEEEKQQIKRIQSNEELRENVANFVVNQMQSIANTDKLRLLIEAEIMRKAALHELDINELRDIYRTISREKTVNTDSLLKLFVPTQTVSPIITPATNQETSESVPLSSEERNALAKLTSVLGKLNKQKEGGEA